MRIFIIGYKSSGKTTLGKKLANALKLHFVDLDDRIEARVGKTIPEFYAAAGEAGFRRTEREVLRQVLTEEDVVIATGGGVPCHGNNMELMEKNGLVIYLRVDNATLVPRMKTAAATRPILKGKSEKELHDYLTDLRLRCEQVYNRARIILDGNNTGISEIVARLKKENLL